VIFIPRIIIMQLLPPPPPPLLQHPTSHDLPLQKHR